MIKQETLEEVCAGLEKMMKKYKQNQNSGDKDRYEATKQAHAALRKVILMSTIKGDVQSIAPMKKGDKYGWFVVENDSSSKSYCS